MWIVRSQAHLDYYHRYIRNHDRRQKIPRATADEAKPWPLFGREGMPPSRPREDQRVKIAGSTAGSTSNAVTVAVPAGSPLAVIETEEG